MLKAIRVSYTLPRDFHPMSLTYFILKIIESRRPLMNIPIRQDEDGMDNSGVFAGGPGTDMGSTIGILIDIEYASNSTSGAIIVAAFSRHEQPFTIMR